uniref:Uncharacterized protein n=1 Tax=Arundo donax TaxID=35708 RepID=A0A0A9A4H5_ARUDO
MAEAVSLLQKATRATAIASQKECLEDDGSRRMLSRHVVT